MENSHNYGDKCGNANIWIEILQCTRKTLAKLNENRHKIAQCGGKEVQLSIAPILQNMYVTLGLFDTFLFSLFLYTIIFFSLFMYFSNVLKE